MVRHLIIVFGKTGQLGNRLFNFANFIAFAAAHDAVLINPAFDEYAEFFETTQRDLLCRFPARRLLPAWICGRTIRHVLYMIAQYLARGIKKLGLTGRFAQVVTVGDAEFYLLDDNPQALDVFRNSRIIFVSGLQFRDIVDMKAYGDAIRSYFAPARRYVKNIDALMDPIQQNCDVLIGMHIRRGDYANHLSGRYFFEINDYIRIMDELETLFPGKRVAFLVSSNESLAGHFSDRANCHFGTGHFLEDMYSLARCNYIVGPPSTYSLWACFWGRVPLCFIQDPTEKMSLSKFVDYFSHVADKEVLIDENGAQYVVVNGERYRLMFKTNKPHLAL